MSQHELLYREHLAQLRREQETLTNNRMAENRQKSEDTITRTALPGFLRFIPGALEKIALYNAENRERYYDKLRRQQRQAYADAKATEGKIVRSYRREIPKLPGESADERKRRLDKEAYRNRAGKDEATVRTYTSLQDMTPEQKRAHERARNARNKRIQRQRSKATRTA